MKKGYGTGGSRRNLQGAAKGKELPPFPKQQMLILGLLYPPSLHHGEMVEAPGAWKRAYLTNTGR